MRPAPPTSSNVWEGEDLLLTRGIRHGCPRAHDSRTSPRFDSSAMAVLRRVVHAYTCRPGARVAIGPADPPATSAARKTSGIGSPLGRLGRRLLVTRRGRRIQRH